MSEQIYPVSQFYKVLEGRDLYKSEREWLALVVVEDERGKVKVKLYRWHKVENVWKVGLANFNVGYWDWDDVCKKATELIVKYG